VNNTKRFNFSFSFIRSRLHVKMFVHRWLLPSVWRWRTKRYKKWKRCL